MHFFVVLGTDYTHGTLENLTKHASCLFLSFFVNAFLSTMGVHTPVHSRLP
jgi:hypothetical protein